MILCSSVLAFQGTGTSQGQACSFTLWLALLSPLLLFPFSDSAAAADSGSPVKTQHIAFLSEMEEDEEEDEDGMPTQVSLISQDGTEQVWMLTASSMWGTAVN